MWIAGLRTFFSQARVDIENLAYARWLIGLLVSACIVVAIFLVYQIFGRWVALAYFAYLAYSPLFLAQTRRVHTDALATSFILLTVLLFLLYCQNRDRWAYLIFSGIVFGLAVLSKSYALILLPWVLVCQFLFREKRSGSFLGHIAKMFCFLNSTILTVLVLCPFFWTPFFGFTAACLLGLTMTLVIRIKNEKTPILWIILSGLGLVLVSTQIVGTFQIVIESINWAVRTPHEIEHFFLGKVINDPGWLFYLFVLTLKSTPLMLPLAFIGCILLWKQRKDSKTVAYQWKLTLAIIASVTLFTFCLSATSKKFSRYLLPVFPLLEILAAIGIVEGIKWGYAILCSRFGTQETNRLKKTLAGIACIIFFIIQILPVVILHPYYGTYYNLCWNLSDITKMITVGEGSGLDLAAHYLNEKPDAKNMLVQVSPLATELVRHYLRGFAYRADRGIVNVADYEIVYIRDSQIGRVPETGTLNGELESVITLNGIEHVWIYRIPKVETP